MLVLIALSTLLLVPTASDAAASLSLANTVSPSSVAADGTVTYSIDIVNNGDSSATGLTLADTMPSTFTYIAGSSRLFRDGLPLTIGNPIVSSSKLTWNNIAVPAARTENYFGMHTFIQDACDGDNINFQLDQAKQLASNGGWVRQMFYGITAATGGPQPCWVDFVNGAYDRTLKPVVRLGGTRNNGFWDKPLPDSPGNYASVAQGLLRVVANLPRRTGYQLYVEVWNEPNLNVEWSNAANPVEYGQFLRDVAAAIRSINDPRIVILNGGLAPGGDYNNLGFIDAMSAVPGAMQAFDLWASHPYPANHPPEYNNHDGTATYPDMAIDSYRLELQKLAKYGRTDVGVLFTETGYALWDTLYLWEGYPITNEVNRADYITRAYRDYWRRWPEVVGVMPFILTDPNQGWSQWHWIYPNGIHHQQYDSVMTLNRSANFLPSKLTLSFQARVGSSGGNFSNRVSLTGPAVNLAIGPTANVYVMLPTATPTPSPTPTDTSTPTNTPVLSDTPTATNTALPTYTPTPTATATPTLTPSATATFPPSTTPTATPTPTPTLTPQSTLTSMPSLTASPTLTYSPTPTATHSPTPQSALTVTSTPIPTSQSTPTQTPTPTSTPTPSRTATPPSTSTPSQTPTPTATLCLPTVYKTVAVGGQPKGLAAGNQRVYVGLHDVPQVAVLDANTGAYLGTLQTGDSNVARYANGVAYAQGKIFVANRDSGSLSVIDGTSGSLMTKMAIGPLPLGVAGQPDRVFVAIYGANQLASLDAISNTLMTKGNTGTEPSFVAVTTNAAYVSEYKNGTVSGVREFDLKGDPLAFIQTGKGPFGLAADENSSRLFVSHRGERTLAVVDLLTHSVSRTVSLPFIPYAVAYNPNSHHLFIVAAESNEVQVYDADTLRSLGALPIGLQDAHEGGQGIAITGNLVFIGNYAASSVTIVSDAPCNQSVDYRFGIFIPAIMTNRAVSQMDSPSVQLNPKQNSIRLNGANGVTVRTGRAPFLYATDQSANLLYIGSGGGDGIIIHRLDTGEELGRVPLPGLNLPIAFAVDETSHRLFALYALAPKYRNVAVIDGPSVSLLTTLRSNLDRPLADVSALSFDPWQRRLLLRGVKRDFVFDSDRLSEQ